MASARNDSPLEIECYRIAALNRSALRRLKFGGSLSKLRQRLVNCFIVDLDW